jgi:gentisate 1,2-dioxygenase
MRDPIQTFLAEMADAFRAEQRDCATQTADALVSFANPEFAPNQVGDESDTIRALLAASPLAVAHAALAVHDELPWGYNPIADQVAAGDDAMYSVLALMGPDAPLFSTTFRAGLYYQKPNTRYGLHSHAAVETYVIIAGRALWTAGDAQREMTAGSSVHHSTYLPHACQTGDEGVVALWRWSGDIGIESYRVHHGTDAFGVHAA